MLRYARAAIGLLLAQRDALDDRTAAELAAAIGVMLDRDPRIAERLTLGEQFERSDWLRIRKMPPLVGEQLALAWD